MQTPPSQDEQHLHLLSIFHYVVGGLTALFSLFPVIHLVIGLVCIIAPEKMEPKGGAHDPAAAFMGWFFVIIAIVFITAGWTLAGVIITAGRFLAARKHYMFCLVAAAIECIFMPFGTVLGIFTIIVLLREPVKQLFGPKP